MEGSGSAPPVPPCTKEQISVMLLDCCLSMALSSSPHVTARLPVSAHARETGRQNCHPEGAGLPVPPDWAAGSASCYKE